MYICLLDRGGEWGSVAGLPVTYCHCRHLLETVVDSYLPFADVKALATYDAFERSAYQLVSAER
jgi:methyl acetate hydrolase